MEAMSRTAEPKIRVVGTHEAAEILGVSRQRIYALERASTAPGAREPKFPRPLARLRATPVWDADELERWNEARARRRTSRPQAQEPPTSREEALRAIEALGQQAELHGVDDDE